MGDIKPISTALLDPSIRDGTRRVLVYVPVQEYDDPTDNNWILCRRGWFTAWWENGTDFYTGKQTGDWYTGFKETMDECGSLEGPTHWAPLPEDPVIA